MRQIGTLTSLRFFCAAGVVFYHLKPPGELLSKILQSCNFAHLVSFFFILSGFVLTLNYKNFSNSKEYLRFYLNRFWRIWPAHIAALCLLLFLVPEVFDIKGPHLGNLCWNALLIHSWNLRPDIYFSFNSASWSNSTELFFYFTFPALILGLKRKPIFTTLALTLCLVVPMLLANYLQLPYFDLKKSSSHGLLYVFPPIRLLEFVSGIVLTQMWLNLQEKQSQAGSWVSKLSIRYSAIFQNGILVTILATVIELAVIANVLAASAMSSKLESFLSSLITMPLACWFCNCIFPILGWILLIFSFAFERGLVSSLLKLQMFIYLGEISFTIYMLHGVLLAWQEVHAPQDMKPLSILVFCLVLILISHIVSRGFELPLRHFALTYYKKLVDKHAYKNTWKIAWVNALVDWSKKYAHLSYWTPVCWRILIAIILLWLYLPSNSYSSAYSQTKNPQEIPSIAQKNSIHLLGASARRLTNGVEICLSWQTPERRPVDFFETVLLSRADGNIVRTQTHSSDVWKTIVNAGTNWKEKFVVTVPQEDEISAVKISLTANRKPVPIICSMQLHSEPLKTILIEVSK